MGIKRRGGAGRMVGWGLRRLVLALLGGGAWVLLGGAATAGENGMLLDAGHAGGSAWGIAACDGCHLINFIHAGTTPKVRALARQKGYPACAGCHGDNGSGAARRCVVCHNPADLPLVPAGSGARGHALAGAGPLADADCVVCHLAADMDGAFELDRDLSRIDTADGERAAYRDTSAFCLRCHNRDAGNPVFAVTAHDYRDPLVAMAENYRHLDRHGEPRGSGRRTYAGLRAGYAYGTRVACTDCHAMHGSHNRALLIDRSLAGATLLLPTLRAANLPVAVEGGNTAQLCVLCHAMETLVEEGERDAGNGLSGVHQVGGDCSLCHRHGLAAQTGL